MENLATSVTKLTINFHLPSSLVYMFFLITVMKPSCGLFLLLSWSIERFLTKKWKSQLLARDLTFPVDVHEKTRKAELKLFLTLHRKFLCLSIYFSRVVRQRALTSGTRPSFQKSRSNILYMVYHNRKHLLQRELQKPVRNEKYEPRNKTIL